GVLRQVRPHDHGSERPRQRAAHLPGRRRRGQAGRVRHLPRRPEDRRQPQLTERRTLMATRPTPYGAFNFVISFDGADFGGFSDCSGLTTEFTIAEYREGTDPENHSRKVPGVYKTGDVTLKRGIVSSKIIWDWVTDVRNRGVMGKKQSVVIKLL